MKNNPMVQAILLLAGCSSAAYATDVAVCTDRGRFVIELADAQSPKHVENFLRYVDMAYYSGTVFHRVVAGFVVQGGGFDRELRGRPSLPPVENESRNGLSNLRGTVAAARTQDPNSATSQFFVNLEDNARLDAGADVGYTVFGRVKEGIEVLDDISRLPTGASGPFPGEVPTPLVAITSIARLDPAALAALPEADRETALKTEIASAAAAGDHRRALQWIGYYRAICGAADPAIALTEAKAALALDELRRAVFVLEDYFALTNDTDPTYEEAVALYRQAVPENQQSAAQLVDDCVPPETPTVPDGSAATTEAMVATQAHVREFVGAGEIYLACLATVIDNEQRTAEDRNAAIGEHNRMVAAMEQIAEDFNAQIRVFKARK
jgi:cyclophilin family peptidyl-prolyl cis-trans isomerase